MDINKLLEGDSNVIINFIKLLLSISSLSSIKGEHLTKISFLDNELQNIYFTSVESYIKIDGNDNNNFNIDINNLEKLNLSESLMNDLKDLKDNFLIKSQINTVEQQSENIGQNMNKIENELFNNSEDIKPIKVEKQVIDNPENINTDKPSKVIVETKTYCNLVKLGKDGIPVNNINNLNNEIINEISFYLNGGDFLNKKITILEDTILKNSEMYNYVIDKYEKDLKNLREEIENINNQHKLEIEKLTKEKDNVLNELSNLSSLKNNSQLEVEKLKKEINESKTKYDELLNNKNLLEKYANDYKSKINLENMKKNNEILELKKKLDEYDMQLNKKTIENEQLNKTIDELKKIKEKEMIDYQKQIKDVTSLKDQEISMLNERIKEQNSNMSDKAMILEKNFENYKINSNKINNELMNQNNALKRQVEEIPLMRQEVEKYKKMYEKIDEENVKIHTEVINLQDKLAAGGKYNHDLNQKIIFLERKLKSDPYYAKEIMSKTLFNFASKIMQENN